jgi:glycogen debranching enzyme
MTTHASPRGPIVFGREICRHADLVDGREWLVTNGLGGYASAAVSGAATRSYHGLLVAAIAPPGDRRLLLSRLDDSIECDGHERLPLASNLWQGGARAPDAARWIERFELVDGQPRWLFSDGDLLLERQIWMEHGHNITWVRYGLLRADGPQTLRLRVLVNQRSFHGGELPVDLRATAIPGGLLVQRQPDDPASLELLLLPEPLGTAVALPAPTAVVYEAYALPRERERGLADGDRHLQVLDVALPLAPGQHLSLRARCLGPDGGATDPGRDGGAAWQRRCQRQQQLLGVGRRGPGAAVDPAPPWITQLVLAADQFLVRRSDPDGPPTTVIAGYHWFQDWGRDTLLSLPGLTLSTGRPELARELLLGFAAAFDRGMLPNRFPELGRPLQDGDYNTVDAALWFFESLRQVLAATDDTALAAQLHDTLAAVLEHHRVGTRFHIGVDPADGLLSCGAPGVQLTWMDAIADGRVITPRRGKPVEINALWLNALVTMARVCERLGRPAQGWWQQAEQVRSSFQRFWNPDRGCCFDVVDSYAETPADPRRDDATVRPNQILAVSLSESGLSAAQQRGVLAVCGRELLTSHGLRSLSPAEAAYAGRYGGGPSQRDSRYHEGTVWGWLLGPYAEAHWRCHHDRDRALGLLEPMGQHLLDGGVGSLSEVFDGDPPHAPDGCIAQAWTVAEVLRCWQHIAASSSPPSSSSPASIPAPTP